MGHSKVVALLTTALILQGCSTIRWSVQKAFREEGIQNESFPERVWKEYDCDTQQRPFFILEENELVPPKVKPGGEFNHRMVYVMCPVQATEVIPGQLSTRVRFKGSSIVTSTDPRYEIRPGRWVVDAFIEIPEDAEPGVYAYEVEFAGEDLHFEKSLTFLVKDP